MGKQKKALEVNIHGIKCDACTYREDSVKLEDYDKWLNKPCPECGANLLTEADYESLKLLLRFANVMNKIFPAPKKGEIIGKRNVEMNGTGNIKFGDIEIIEE